MEGPLATAVGWAVIAMVGAAFCCTPCCEGAETAGMLSAIGRVPDHELSSGSDVETGVDAREGALDDDLENADIASTIWRCF